MPKYGINQLINDGLCHILDILYIFITVDIGGEENCRKGMIYII